MHYNMPVKAETGQMGEAPSTGIHMEEVLSLSCIVFDHLTIIIAECLANIISSTHKCLVLSKEET